MVYINVVWLYKNSQPVQCNICYLFSQLHMDTDITCQHCTNGTQHPLFVYLARDGRIPEHSVTNAYCYIGISRHPFHRLIKQQNRASGWRVGSKATKPIAPHWKLELVVGPFIHGKGGDAFKHVWRRSSRRFNRRVKYGVQHAKLHKAQVFCSDTAFIKRVIKTV